MGGQCPQLVAVRPASGSERKPVRGDVRTTVSRVQRVAGLAPISHALNPGGV